MSATGALAKRSIIGTLRQPAVLVPSIFFPLFFAALNSASFERTTRLPGFPVVRSFLDFMLAATVVQGVLFGGTGGGTDMAVDIQDGFFDRLLTAPVPRWTLLVGRLAGSAVLGAVQGVVFTVALMAFGARLQGGVAAFVVIVLVGMVLALAIGGFGLALALRTGSSESVQASFPVFFISLFLSSAFFPRNLMHGWFKTAAGINPLSWLIEGLRNLVINGWAVRYVVNSLAVAAALAVVSIVVSSLALRRRLRGMW